MKGRVFLAGVGNAFLYTRDGSRLILSAKTLQNTSFERTVQKTVQRGGKGNGELSAYYHDAEDAVTLVDAQLNFEFLAMQNGKEINIGSVVPVTNERVTFTGGAGTLKNNPLPAKGLAAAYAHVELDNGGSDDVSLTSGDKAITLSDTTFNGEGCVSYYALNPSAYSFDIPAEVFPNVARLEIHVELLGDGFGSDGSSKAVIGWAVFRFPNYQLDPAFSLSMNGDGYSNTTIKGTCKPAESDAFTCGEDGGSGSVGTIEWGFYNQKWYDAVDVLTIENVENGEFVVASGTMEELIVRGRSRSGNYVCAPDYLDLLFTTDPFGDVTVTEYGIVSSGTNGGTVTVSVPAKPALTVTVNVVPE